MGRLQTQALLSLSSVATSVLALAPLQTSTVAHELPVCSIFSKYRPKVALCQRSGCRIPLSFCQVGGRH
ncbi:exported hypothetical protein [Cupriavidus phytorum]|uniref:Secreted protein n=1 Tax=Cupriavidus taiwanensis TaxID=164546 RepID=A0A375CJ10_9BURK|nr:exported hypothetical protein [Cupriavidus taiwanensis]